MDRQGESVILYTAQRPVVRDLILRDGVYTVKRRFIRDKHQESAPLFLAVYDWYAQNAARIVPRPPEAESAVWAFPDPADLFAGADSCVLKLEVPVEEAVFFDMMDWNRLLNFAFLGDEAEGARFQKELREQGITDPSAVATTPFYPLLKGTLLQSWSNLFRHHQAIRAGNTAEVPHVQAGLWRIRREWLLETR